MTVYRKWVTITEVLYGTIVLTLVVVPLRLGSVEFRELLLLATVVIVPVLSIWQRFVRCRTCGFFVSTIEHSFPFSLPGSRSVIPPKTCPKCGIDLKQA